MVNEKDVQEQLESDELFAYIRISPTDLDHSSKGAMEADAERLLGLQRSSINGYCSTHFPKKHIRWYADKLISGTSLKNRVAFSSLKDDAIKEKPYAIIFTKVDRFARSAKDLLDTVDDLSNGGVTNIIATQQPVDTTNPYGKALFQLLGVFAELEVAMIRERTNAGKLVRKAQMEAEGRNWGRPIHVVKNRVTGQKLVLKSEDVINMYKSIGSATGVADALHCSITPIIRILKEKTMM